MWLIIIALSFLVSLGCSQVRLLREDTTTNGDVADRLNFGTFLPSKTPTLKPTTLEPTTLKPTQAPTSLPTPQPTLELVIPPEQTGATAVGPNGCYESCQCPAGYGFCGSLRVCCQMVPQCPGCTTMTLYCDQQHNYCTPRTCQTFCIPPTPSPPKPNVSPSGPACVFYHDFVLIEKNKDLLIKTKNVDVNIGDVIKGAGKVILKVMHSEGKRLAIMRELTCENGSVTVSLDHIVHSKKGPVKSSDLIIGDYLSLENDQYCKIKNIKEFESDMYLGIITESGTLIVNGFLISDEVAWRNLDIIHRMLRRSLVFLIDAGIMNGLTFSSYINYILSFFDKKQENTTHG